MKRVFVSLPDEIWNILKKDFAKMGESESEILRGIVVAYLSDRGYFVNQKGYVDAKDVKDRLLVTEKMIESLIDALEEKTDVTYVDIERIMKKKLHASTGA